MVNVRRVFNTEQGRFLHAMLLLQLYWADKFETVCEMDFPQKEKYSYNIDNLDSHICYMSEILIEKLGVPPDMT
jgi:hypothetical protein